ncbi:hypothetical protein LJB96_03060 [Methanobrevibacter sp. OttesenSCG-928-K11]|nr:hypothetical protein [Methanobrevibacter sp. OttesenSCG-928-K11]MDL2270503.1 hypothetical protein [Methanobrevibacter sp. OttesenSCG-928-I08]
MKMKNILKISLLVIFLVLGFSVGLVSAEENTGDLNEFDNNEIVNDLGTNGYRGDGGNFTILQEDVNNAIDDDGILNLNGNYTWVIGDSIDGIVINGNLIINGNGNTIDAQNSSRIFFTKSNFNVTFNNIKLINGYTSGQYAYGAAIYNFANLTIDNCTFINNTANGTSGGAIYNYGDANVILTNSSFINNIARGGGAIYNSGGVNFTVIGSTFTSSIATYYGGAIYNSEGVNFTVVDSTFINNTADDGGVIYNFEGVNFTVFCSIFTDNTAEEGGVIYNGGGVNFTVFGSIFNSNNATGSGGAIYNNATGSGGVIYNHKVDFTVVASNFTGNTARFGGVIYNNWGDDFSLVDSTFTNNYATRGGVIYNAKGVNFMVIGSIFNNNNALIDSGTIFNGIGVNFTVVSSTFISNTAHYGGAMYNIGKDSILNVFYSVFYNNSAYSGDNVYSRSDNVYLDDNFWGTNNILFIEKSIDGIDALNSYYTVKFDTANNLSVGDNMSVNIYLNGTNNSEGSEFLPEFMLQVKDSADTYLGEFSSKNQNLAFNTMGTYDLTLLYDNIVILDTITYDVYKRNITINLDENYIIGYWDNITINGTVTGLINGDFIDIYLYKDNLLIDTIFTNGSFIFNTYFSLDLGNHTFSFVFNETDKYNSNYTNTTLTVNKDTLNISVNILKTIIYGNTATINGIVSDLRDLDNVTLFLYVDGILNQNITVFDSNFSFNVAGLEPGQYNIIISLKDNKYCNDLNSTNTILTVSKVPIKLEADNITMLYRDGKYIVVLSDINGKFLTNHSVNITVNGKTYTKRTDVNGTATLNINLNPREYNITTEFNGTKYYLNNSITTVLNVISPLITNDLVKYYLNDSQFIIQVVDINGKGISNASVSFNINGIIYNKTTNSTGHAVLNINLYSNEYIITTTYNGYSVSNNINVSSTLIGSNLNKTFSENKTYDVKVLDGKGQVLSNQTVEININGVKYYKDSNSNGIAKLDINLNPGSYIATATWNNYSTSNKIIVKE